jgi:hypothetical protein
MKSYFAWLLLAIVSAIAPDLALGQTPGTFTVSSNANGATFVAETGFEPKIAGLRDFEKRSTLASPGNRLHKLGHRKVTIPLKTRWLTPAGLCVSTGKFWAFARCQHSMTSKPRDAPDDHHAPKRLKSGPKAQNLGTPPKLVPGSQTLRNTALS